MTVTSFQANFFYCFVFFTVGNCATYAITYPQMVYNVTTIFNETYLEKEGRLAPYISWVPFSIKKSPNYELVFLYQVTANIIYGFYIGATDSIMTGMIIHIRAQWLILKLNFSKLTEFEFEEKIVSFNVVTELLNSSKIIVKTV